MPSTSALSAITSRSVTRFERGNRVRAAAHVQRFETLGRVVDGHVDVLEGTVEVRGVGHRGLLDDCGRPRWREVAVGRGPDQRRENEYSSELGVASTLLAHSGDGALESAADPFAVGGPPEAGKRSHAASHEVLEPQVVVVVVSVHVAGFRRARYLQ